MVDQASDIPSRIETEASEVSIHICRHAIPASNDPDIMPPGAMCKKTGRSIESHGQTNTGYLRCDICPFKKYTNKKCEVIKPEAFESLVIQSNPQA